jgi:hypothetical protein
MEGVASRGGRMEDESGTTYGDRNGYTVTFTGMEKVKAPHITNNWDVLVSA